MAFKEGCVVERVLDDAWFPARILSCTFDKLFDVEYLDDGKIERDVPAEDLRMASKDAKLEKRDEKTEDTTSALLKHLLPHEETKVIECTPKVIRYGVNDDTKATALILGPQEDVAHGGGLRALRTLKRRPQVQ
mmetsp:Transcript_8751/g.33003  ORF Transcript_8751/g.33003 Transcript_8751/m.33003 type:complete len:134 (+) Transcript_8751:171-572(+)|eukprot:scaffold5944_cov248-Pinguiococcus_pyrenoidosus.AAC.8